MKVWESGAKGGHESLNVATATASFMQGIFVEQHAAGAL
jgi:hypothetical protein